jgi:hypothetical protein
MARKLNIERIDRRKYQFMKNNKLKVALIVCVAAITVFALGLRIYASSRLEIDNDETTYLTSALKYTNYIREGKYSWLAWDETNYEHPSLYKIIYGVALLPEPPLDKIQQSDFIDNTPITQAQAVQYGMADRQVSAVFGSLAVLALAIVNPLAGFFLAINTLAIKYTSEVYLEALPMLTSLLCVLAYAQYYRTVVERPAEKKKQFLWLGASALFLGMTAASKYVYCVCAIAIALHWLIGVIRKKVPARHLLLLLVWALVSFMLFFAFDPYLWPHPLDRLIATVGYHIKYSNSQYVLSSGYPFWQPLIWLFNPFVSYKVSSSTAMLIHLDPLIFILALIGLPRAFKKNNLFFIWFVLALAFLLIWQTKWQQYPSILMVPYCYIAAMGVMTLYDWVKKKIVTSRFYQNHFAVAKSA